MNWNELKNGLTSIQKKKVKQTELNKRQKIFFKYHKDGLFIITYEFISKRN